FHLPVARLIKATFFKQFIGGESLTDCDTIIKDLKKYHVGAILDYAVEGKKSEKDFLFVTEEIKKTILKAKNNPEIPFTVFKVSGIGSSAILEKVNSKSELSDTEKTAFQNIKSRVNEICKFAYENNVRILMDAEESWIQ